MPQPAHKRARLSEAFGQTQDDGCGKRVRFRITSCKRLSKQRVVPLAAGVADHFSARDLPIILHASTITGELEQRRRAVYCEPLAVCSASCNPCAVLCDLGRDVHSLQARFLAWRTHGCVRLSIANVTSDDDGVDQSMSLVLADFVERGAFPGRGGHLEVEEGRGP